MKQTKILHKAIVSSAALCAMLALGCEVPKQDKYHAHDAEKAEPKVTKAVAHLSATQGNDVYGTVTFEKVEEGVKVTAEVANLTPGKHGFHIHQFGDCSADDGTSAGGHFNPHGTDHGGPDAHTRHVGDLGNLDADESGNATLEFVDKHLAFGGEESILGRSVIVHAGEDDLTTQPTGAAGARVACGVIGVIE